MWSTEDPPLTTELEGGDLTWTSDEARVVESSIDPIMLAMFIAASVSFVLNGFVLSVMMTSRKLRRKLSVMFLVHQCACDCFSGGCILIFYTIEKIYGEVIGTLGLLYCKLLWSQFIVYGALNAGVFNTVCLSIERYMAVVHPLKYKRMATRSNFKKASLFCWFLGIALNTPYIPMSTPINGKCELVPLLNSAKLTKAFSGLSTCISFLLPLLIIMVLYAQMFNTLHKRKQGLSMPSVTVRSDHQSQDWTDKIYNAQIKLIRIVVLLEVSCVVSWTPYNVYFFLFSIGKDMSFDDTPYYVSVVMSVTNLIINPTIYICGYEEFHACVKKLICGQKFKDRTESQSWSVSQSVRY